MGGERASPAAGGPRRFGAARVGIEAFAHQIFGGQDRLNQQKVWIFGFFWGRWWRC